MFDGQVVRPPQAFREAARDYVCVRIVNINQVDLTLYPFDYDLTLAILLAHPDGTVYHRYGGRDHVSPMNMGTLVGIMKEGLNTHRAYLTNPRPPPRPAPRRISDLIENQLSGKIEATFGCYHCHYVREAQQLLTLEAGQWTPDQFWIWPLPDRLGLVMNQKQQFQVYQVVPDSPALKAGIRPGDRLLTLDDRRILTKYDIQWILEQTTNTAHQLPFTLFRKGRLVSGHIELPEEWKVGDPREDLWRVHNVFTEHMTKFLPAPGFIGTLLPGPERATLGLAPDRFALRITHLNHGTYLAGIRLGDTILSANGKSNFAGPAAFHQWCEALRKAGRDIRMELMRQQSRMNVMIGLEHLNWSRVARAPRVKMGFIVQELAGNRGLRVGHVTDDSSAERTGLLIGDRIVSVDGLAVRDKATLTGLLNDKSPGDLITLSVTRDGTPLQFSYVLPGESVHQSDLAHLTDVVREPGQAVECVVTLKLPQGKHVYSVHRQGFGLPTHLEFRGRGYQLAGPLQEPPPRQVSAPGVESMWILEGNVELRQAIRVTDPARFQLLLRVYAQVCDDRSCHELRSVVVNDGHETTFTQFHGRFEQLPRIHVRP